MLQVITDENKIREAGETIWPGCEVKISDRTVRYTLPKYSEVSNIKFQHLNQLSELLGTDQIDLEKGEHHEGFAWSSWTYEGSCDDPPSVIVYRIEGDYSK